MLSNVQSKAQRANLLPMLTLSDKKLLMLIRFKLPDSRDSMARNAFARSGVRPQSFLSRVMILQPSRLAGPFRANLHYDVFPLLRSSQKSLTGS